MNRWMWLAAACVLGVAMLSGPLPSECAADSVVGRYDPENSPSRVEYKRLCKILQLSDAQQTAAQSLFDEYSRRLRNAQDKWNRYNESQRQRQLDGETSWKRQLESYRKFYEYGERIRAERNRDIQLLLTEAQAANWHLFERAVRRFECLTNNGQFSGGRFEVSAETERVLGNAEMGQEIAVALEEYEVAIDRQARILEAHRRMTRERYFAAAFNRFENDDWESDSLVMEGFEASRAARDINIRFARRIMGLLTPEQAESLESALLRSRGWSTDSGQSYSRTLEGLLESVELLESLDASQSAKLEDIKASFAEQERAQTRREFDACVEFEAGQTYKQLIRAEGRADSHPAIRAAAEARSALADRIVCEIRGVLTEEQLAELGPPFLELPEMLELNFDED